MTNLDLTVQVALLLLACAAIFVADTVRIERLVIVGVTIVGPRPRRTKQPCRYRRGIPMAVRP